MRAKKGKLLQFPKKFEQRTETTEGGLQRLFWANVEKDFRRIARLYVAQQSGLTVNAEEFTQHLVAFRHDQGRTPSAHISDIQRAFLLATASYCDKMHNAFCEEKASLSENEIKYHDQRYQAAVQNAVVNDTSEIIAFAVQTWFHDKKKIRLFYESYDVSNEGEMLGIFIDVLKDLVPTNGVDLRQKIEGRSGRAMGDGYKEPNFKIKEPAVMLPFPMLA